jgi:hypothetical protein
MTNDLAITLRHSDTGSDSIRGLRKEYGDLVDDFR